MNLSLKNIVKIQKLGTFLKISKFAAILWAYRLRYGKKKIGENDFVENLIFYTPRTVLVFKFDFCS